MITWMLCVTYFLYICISYDLGKTGYVSAAGICVIFLLIVFYIFFLLEAVVRNDVNLKVNTLAP